MRLGIMQPYFFPYLGYFSLIKHTDHFIFFDTPQYERRSWMNRNRILNSNKEAAYISVPLQKAPRETAIKDMLIDNSQNWKADMVAKMPHYKKHAPYYKETVELFERLLAPEYKSLADLNIATTTGICKHLGIGKEFQIFSQMDMNMDNVSEADEWALEITRQLGYDTYINPPGGMSFFDREKYKNAGIELQFLQSKLPPYVQRIGRFEPGLSILDVLMFNTVDEINAMLDEFELL